MYSSSARRSSAKVRTNGYCTFANVRANVRVMPATTRPRRKSPVDHDPQALKWARERAGWRQAALAREVGVAPSTLCEAERGTRGLHPDVKNKLAAVLGCPVTVFERKRNGAPS